ncbi:hypothetical protein HID58_080516, partial [Brassica napus]
DKEANKNPDEDIESEQRPERGIIDGEKKQEEVSMGAGEHRSGKKAEVVSGKEVVSKLLEDLESIQTIKGKAANGGSLEVNVSANQVLQSREGSDSPLNGNWSLVAVTNTIPSVLSVGVKEVGTMNGFQALQDIREEGKIDEEDVEDGHEEDVEESELEEGKSIQVEERVLKGLLQTLEI